MPVILYAPGLGSVFGGPPTHDRRVRRSPRHRSCGGFPDYSLFPEAKYPTAIEEIFVVVQSISTNGAEHGLDTTRIAVVGDSLGGNMATVTAPLAKQWGGTSLKAQVLRTQPCTGGRGRRSAAGRTSGGGLIG